MTDIWNLYTNDNELFDNAKIKQMTNSITEAVVKSISDQCSSIVIETSVIKNIIEEE